MNLNKALTEEAVRLLDISDAPDLYHSLRRWARVHIKHEEVSPIDIVNWPKGCLMCGLMHEAVRLKSADNSADRAVSIYAMASVQSYIDRWLEREAPVYFMDDVMAGWAMLALAENYRADAPELYDRYMRASQGVMSFLHAHDTDSEGVMPYRPAQATGQIFADGIGMTVPFMIRYGLMREDDDAIDLALRQITAVMDHLIDPDTGLPWHVYSLSDNPEGIVREGALGWGRALGWIMYGLGASAEACDLYAPRTPLAIRAHKQITEYLDELVRTALKYRRDDGLWGSLITDPASPADTSASAMILYAMKDPVDLLIPHITSAGRVMQAQGECMGIGIYSQDYGSYPWSVGMTLLLI